MRAVTDELFASHFAILRDLFSDIISVQEAVRDLASISLSMEPEAGLGRLWAVIVECACESPEHHDKLVEILVQLSKLPNPTTASGDTIIVYDMQIWKDLPMLGWALRDQWNMSVPSGPPDHRQGEISKIINRDKFTALLMATEEPIFAYSWFALFTLRNALEIPTYQMLPIHTLEEVIPSAAAWISILGVEIYEWDEDLSGYAGMRPGMGGPLWKGKHGFCKERWQLWRERFGEVARMSGEIGDDARTAAREAEQMMWEIENGEVE